MKQARLNAEAIGRGAVKASGEVMAYDEGMSDEATRL